MQSQQFEVLYQMSRSSIPFDPAWDIENGSSQHINDFHVPPGEIVSSYNEEDHARVLLMGTKYGTVSIIENNVGRDVSIYRGAFPEKLQPIIRKAVCQKQLTDEDLKRIALVLLGIKEQQLECVGTLH